jgi:hypothetical protein
VLPAADTTNAISPETEAQQAPAERQDSEDSYFSGDISKAFQWIADSVTSFYTEDKSLYHWNRRNTYYRNDTNCFDHYHKSLRQGRENRDRNDLESTREEEVPGRQVWSTFLWSTETHKRFRKAIAAISILLENGIDILEYIEFPTHRSLLNGEPDLYMLVGSSENHANFIQYIEKILATELGNISYEDYVIGNKGPKAWLKETLDNNPEALRVFSDLVSLNDFTYRFYYQAGELNEIPVISSFSNLFSSNLDLNEIAIVPLNYTKEYFSRNVLYLKGRGADDNIKHFFTPTIESQKSISCIPGGLADICTGKSSTVLGFLPETTTKYTVLHLPNWGNSRSTLAPGFKEVTRAACRKRKGLFFPVLYNAEIRDENFELKKVYVLCFVLIQNNKFGPLKGALEKFTAASKSMHGFISKYIEHDGLYFKSKEEYLAAQREKFKATSPFINIELLLESNNSSAFQFFQEKQKEIELLDKKRTSTYTPLGDEQRRLLSSRPESNLRLDLKLTKIKKKLAVIKINVNSQLASTSRVISQRLDACRYVFNYRKSLFLFNQEDMRIKLNSLQKYTRLLDRNKRFTQQKTEHARLAFKENRTTLDPFYENMFNDGIKILSVVYSGSWRNDQSGKDGLITIDFRSDLTSPKTEILLKEINNVANPPIIQEVELLIDKPIKIYVNSRTNSSIPPKVGGPYIIAVRKSSLEIKCKDKTSLYGHNSNRYLIHPHASRRSDPFSYANACLGEAQSLLWNAFQKNCLKNIILAALTWVTSANSADSWGRDYKFFLDYKYIKSTKSESEIIVKDETVITETEVNDFLGAETTEEIFDTEEALTETEVLGWLDTETTEIPAPVSLPSEPPTSGAQEIINETDSEYIAYVPIMENPPLTANRNDDLY